MAIIRLKDYFVNCTSREKGKTFYQFLLKFNTHDFEFDFSGIEFISTSFLDESIWKLAADGKRIIIHDPDSLLEEKLDLVRRWRPEKINIFKSDFQIRIEPSYTL